MGPNDDFLGRVAPSPSALETLHYMPPMTIETLLPIDTIKRKFILETVWYMVVFSEIPKFRFVCICWRARNIIRKFLFVDELGGCKDTSILKVKFPESQSFEKQKSCCQYASLNRNN